MKSFWIIYIAVVVVGSGIVWFASPLARPLMSRMMKKDDPVVVSKAVPVPSVKKAGSASKDVTQASVNTEPSKAASASASADKRDDPPALLGIFRVTGKRKPEWGVVWVKTNFYNEEGRRLGEVPAGLIIDFVESRKSSKGTMVFCRFQYKGKVHGPYLVKRTDMSLFTGNYLDLSKNQRSNFESYYKTKGLIEERKVEVMQQMARKNPHYTQYKSAYDKYIDHIEEAKELIVQRDKSTGLRRSRLEDKLRLMKNQEVSLENSYKRIHKKYKSWKTANNSTLPDNITDPKIKEYRMEMRRLAKLLPGLAY